MTSTPSILLLKRSGQSADRPSGSVIQNGELAIAVGAADPGLYFEDSAGSIRKIGPNHYATTAPNSSPVGLAGNSVGETWTDSSTTNYYFRVWTGTAWVKVGAGMADTATSATTATTATTANFATTAGSATTATTANFATTAGFANTASGIPAANVAAALPGSAPVGSLFYLTGTGSGLYVQTAAGWAQV